MRLYSAVTSSSWHSQLKKKNYTVNLFKVCFFQDAQSASLLCSFSKLFFFCLFFGCCACAAFWESVRKAEKDTSLGGSSPALHRQRGSRGRGGTALCISCGALGLAEKLTLTQCTWLTCFLPHLCNWEYCWGERQVVAFVLNTNPAPKCSLAKWPFSFLRQYTSEWNVRLAWLFLSLSCCLPTHHVQCRTLW